MKTEKKETSAIVLDILPKGYADDPRPVYKREPIIQAVGVDQFKLLELIPKSVPLSVHEKVYIGDDEREKVERVKRRISYSDLTQTARLELPFAVETIVKANEPRFVQFFNRAISITPKLHMLHLLPGIGKKLMWEILAEREKKSFESFDDIRQRIKAITKPDKMVISRILQELEEPEIKYRVFTTK
jgi:putative nucleotide binding protein